MSIITEFIGVGAISTIILMVIAKVLPNEKTYIWGIKSGQFLDSFGHAKIGNSWEKVEDLFINSFGRFFAGLKIGFDLPIDDPIPPMEEDWNYPPTTTTIKKQIPPKEGESKSDNVRK